MKTELDFTKVPLDKWVDFYKVYDATGEGPRADSAFRDIKKAAETQVKEEADLNKEIADAATQWFLDYSMPKNDGQEIYIYLKLKDAIDTRAKMLGIVPVAKEEPAPEQKPELLPVEEVIK